MTESHIIPGADNVPTVKAFSDLTLPRYYVQYGREDLYENLECFEEYEPGGFCPIDLSFGWKPSFLNGRFEVIYKLGWGGFGTVWLCYEGAVKKWRAVKVGRGSLKKEDSGEDLVESIMKQHSVGVAEAMENSIVLPLETFWIESINGRHLCQVLPLLGPRLSDWLEWLQEDDPKQTQRIISQMTKGMNFLHSHGVCHGDFRPQNILMQLKDGGLDDIGIDEMCEDILGEPHMVDIILRNGSVSPYSPAKAYYGVRWRKLSKYVSDKVAIVGFGEAYLTTNANPGKLGIPGPYGAPEILIGEAKGIATDIWALARSIFEARSRLFFPMFPDVLSKIDDMEDFAGPCPSSVIERVTARKLGGGSTVSPFDEDQNQKGIEPSEPLKDILDCIDLNRKQREEQGEEELGRPVDRFLSEDWLQVILDREEVNSLGDLLQNLFRWESKERWGTDKILAHRWFSETHKAAKTKWDEKTHDSKPEMQTTERQDDTTTNPSNIIDVSDSTTVLPGSDADSPQVMPRQKTAWFYSKLLTMAFYGAGIFVTMVFFLAHMLSRQPGSYTDSQTVSSHEPPISQLTTLVEYVIITLDP